MKFAAVIDYTPDKAKIAEVRPAHRDYLSGLLKDGKLVVAGPFTDDSGAIIVYETETAEQAESVLKGDPFCQRGIFVSWKIRPWKVVFVSREMFPTT
jgi:uncharacterized protein